jgi:phage FluMu protein Com
MSIQFRCEGCGKLVQAPDSAGGRQGKCPACGHIMYVPLPPEQREEVPVAEEDPQEEKQRRRLLKESQEALGEVAREHKVGIETQGAAAPSSRTTAGDMESLIVAYALAMADGQLDRADRLSAQITQDPDRAHEAMERISQEQPARAELAGLPRPVLVGFLKQLRSQL